MPPATPTPTCNAPSRFTNGEETPGDSGQLTLAAAADLYTPIFIHICTFKLKGTINKSHAHIITHEIKINFFVLEQLFYGAGLVTYLLTPWH